MPGATAIAVLYCTFSLASSIKDEKNIFSKKYQNESSAAKPKNIFTSTPFHHQIVFSQIQTQMNMQKTKSYYSKSNLRTPYADTIAIIANKAKRLAFIMVARNKFKSLWIKFIYSLKIIEIGMGFYSRTGSGAMKLFWNYFELI